jgi:hypothetical protein
VRRGREATVRAEAARTGLLKLEQGFKVLETKADHVGDHEQGVRSGASGWPPEPTFPITALRRSCAHLTRLCTD